MKNVTPLHQHAYLDDKQFTLAELQAASGSAIYLKQGRIETVSGFYTDTFLWRELVNIYGETSAERILPKRIEYVHSPKKLNNKFASGKVAGYFTPFGFTLEQLSSLTQLVVCAGLADGYRLYQSLEIPVAAAVGENQINNLIEQIRQVNPQCYIVGAGDNDLAGINAVHKTGCDYILPDSQKDWSDIYQREGAKALYQQASNVRKALPLFPDRQYPHKLERLLLANELPKNINRLARCENLYDAASLIYSLLDKYEFRMPFEVDIDELRDQLIVQGKHTINAENIKTLVGIVDFRIRKRQRQSLSLTSFKLHEIKRRHHLHLLPGLPHFEQILPGFEGVLLIRAPKGMGKTELIGQPFVEANQNKGFTLATCHRASLTEDLKERLNLDWYKDSELRPDETTGLAICLASIDKEKFNTFIENVDYIFTDEIKQTLDFMSSDKCSSNGKTNADVYQRFKKLVANAKCIVGVDADLNARVIEFIELCRPNEKFQIYDIDPHSQKHIREGEKIDFIPANNPDFNIKKNVGYIIGKDAETRGYGDILNRIKDGQNIWISVESSSRVTVLKKLIESQLPGTKVLALNSDNKNAKAQKAFLANPNKEAVKYQVVIHSPVISSGVSIKSDPDDEHFDHTYFIGSGHRITPSDASQMLARVRYVHHYTLLLIANNTSKQVKDHRAIIIGKEQASIQDGKHLDATEFDRFCAKVTEDEYNAKADFANGLLWLLKQEGHKLKAFAGSDVDFVNEIKASKFETECEWQQWVNESIDINVAEAFELSRKTDKSITEICQLEKYTMLNALNVKKLSDYDWEMWNDGRLMAEMRRFDACFNQTAFNEKEDVSHLHHRKFSKAKVWAYQYIFDDIDLEKGRVTQLQAEQIVSRIIKKRYMLAELGVVPRKFAKYYELRKDGSDPFPMPLTPMKDVQSIFRLMGISMKRKDNYHAEDITKRNDYQLNSEKVDERHELSAQIDFSRLGGYTLKDKAVSAEITAEKWQQTKQLITSIVDVMGDVFTARKLLDAECQKLGLTSENDEVKDLYKKLRRVS